MVNQREEITFMQARIIRLFIKKYSLPMEKVISTLKSASVLEYIEKCYNIFHCEGDNAVFEDVCQYLKNKGVTVG